MSALLTGALAALEARAGASSENRTAWLLERSQGITGTQIRDLKMGKDLGGNKVTMDGLVRIKLGIDLDPFRMNRYVEWGNVREPFMAAAAQWRYGLAPESRVFCAVEDSRFLISPDGVGTDFDEQLRVGEYKTGNDIAVGSPAFEKKGYMLQMQWAMFVTGAPSCLYVWEERLTLPDGSFAPGEMHFELVERDESIIAGLVSLATAFVERLEEATADSSIVTGAAATPVVDEVLDTHAVNYLRAKDVENEGKRAKETAWAALKAGLAGHETFEQESPLARIKWTRGGTVDETVFVSETVTNRAQAELENPRVFEATQKARESVLRATQRLAKAEAVEDEVLKAYTIVSPPVPGRVSRPVRENLTVTSVRTKEMTA